MISSRFGSHYYSSLVRCKSKLKVTIVQLCPMKKTNATILSFILRAKVTSVRNFKHRKNQIASPPRCN
ncbi:hypothetical protein EB796_002363 [Bugula neritina]|uniref:Uncharacterized protein n=1 Tax=Bugula neritina TaxID=10212 RepID=A0A7J7KMG7_BUGNE|nr:hypothetical protein EB796_002363 [Bugula neritina]